MDTKLLRNNLFILLGYAVLAQLLSLTEKNGAGIMVAMIMMVAVAIHVGVLVLGSLVQLASNKRREARQWILSALLIGVVGFGTCMGGMALGELYSGPANFH
jgi:small-conductance mechanosensitive channel